MNDELDMLDDSRVHPESYSMAISFCLTALQGTKHYNPEDDDAMAVEKACEKPHLLESVDVSVSAGPPHSPCALPATIFGSTALQTIKQSIWELTMW